MENLNAEKVVKGLECCSADTTDCNNCPYSEFSEGNCFDNAKKDALALIKELTEENERLIDECGNQSVLWKQHFESLYETAKETVKADTVTKMQVRLK